MHGMLHRHENFDAAPAACGAKRRMSKITALIIAH